MKRVATLVPVLAVVLATALFAQAKPDFTGKWTQVEGRTGGAGGLGQGFVADQSEKTLILTTNFPQTGEIKTIYNLDGSETKNPLTVGGMTVTRTSRVRWDANKLVIATTVTMPAGGVAETTQTWSLEASGNLTVVQVSNFGGNETTRAIYKKG